MTQAVLKTNIKDRSLILYGISWRQLETLEAAFAEVTPVKFFYLDGTLEIMTTSPEHEDAKKTIAYLIETYMREKNIRFYRKGGPTLGSEEKKGRKEPDESYNLQTKKATPDLVIEVIFTSGGIDKLEFYKRIGVPEIWFWEDGTINIYHLREEYEKVNRSILLPNLDLQMLIKYINYYDQYDAVKEFINELRNSPSINN
ncbi:MAG: Uma2 family endonuclease [Okeania sp. SIO2H7]|nr:Uma2 family endonuclease [Okeania sp. SIO2H7]